MFYWGIFILIYHYRSCGSGKTKLVTNVHGPQKELADYYIDSEFYRLKFHFIYMHGIILRIYIFL